jgi:hypothetical protein
MRSVKEIVLAFIDAVMERTVPAHEKRCDEGKCSVEHPCDFCTTNDILMEEAKKFDASDSQIDG